MRLSLTTRLFFFLLALAATNVQGQTPAPGHVLTMAAPSTAADAPPAIMGTANTNTMTLKGRVESLTGSLVGAVVTLHDHKGTKVVTDADGFFSLTVPSTDQPVGITASFAGYDDVNANLSPGTQPAIVRLVVFHEIKVRKKNQLKTYLKTANKQVKKDLRQVHH